MESIKKIYKKGYGPSSSHTLGPNRAAISFREKNPTAAKFRVTLHGSLAATGKGHHTDKAIIEGSAPIPVELIWKPEVVLPFHTNGMLFEALDADGKVYDNWTIYSVGGGSLANEETQESVEHLYEHHFMSDILAYIEKEGLTYWEYVEQHEEEDIWEYLEQMWETMQHTIEEGLQAEGDQIRLSKRDSVITGSITLSCNCPASAAKLIVVSLPITLKQT